MKKAVIGVLAASLIFYYGVGTADAKGKETKKPNKTVQVDKDQNGIPDDWQNTYHLGYGKAIAGKDFDKDGLTNLQEYQLNLNPRLKDTDKDTIPDGQEDNDNDGLTNLQEIQAKLSPVMADTDQDGILDPNEDNDQDGLTTKQEFLAKTNPLLADTNKNGVKDSNEDTDKDKLTTAEEFELGTDPLNADSNHNGIPDGEEDNDGDHIANYIEYEMGYSPVNADSDHNGILDGNEDQDGDGITNSSELRELQIKLVDVKGNSFKLEYEDSKTKVKDTIGIENAQDLVNQLKLTPEMTKDEIIMQIKQALGVTEYRVLKVEVQFANGVKSEIKDGAGKVPKHDNENENRD